MEEMTVQYFYVTAQDSVHQHSPRIWKTEVQLSSETCSYSKMADQLLANYSGVHDAVPGS